MQERFGAISQALSESLIGHNYPHILIPKILIPLLTSSSHSSLSSENQHWRLALFAQLDRIFKFGRNFVIRYGYDLILVLLKEALPTKHSHSNMSEDNMLIDESPSDLKTIFDLLKRLRYFPQGPRSKASFLDEHPLALYVALKSDIVFQSTYAELFHDGLLFTIMNTFSILFGYGPLNDDSIGAVPQYLLLYLIWDLGATDSTVRFDPNENSYEMNSYQQRGLKALKIFSVLSASKSWKFGTANQSAVTKKTSQKAKLSKNDINWNTIVDQEFANLLKTDFFYFITRLYQENWYQQTTVSQVRLIESLFLLLDFFQLEDLIKFLPKVYS